MKCRGAILALALAAGSAGCGGSASTSPSGASASSAGSATTPAAGSSGTSASTSGTSAGASGSSGSGSMSTPTASAPTSGACRKVPAPPPKGPQHLAVPSLKLDPRLTYRVSVQTNCGDFAFDLDVRNSPRTTASFYYLVKRGFFDGLTFHRVAAGFVIQGGDPLGDGTGGPGYRVIEPPPRGIQYLRGTVAMAKAGNEPSGASGSQFFIVTAANATQSAGLTPDYAVVGHVVSGLSTVQAIGVLPTQPPQDGAPEIPVVMSRVTVSTG